MWGDKDSRPRGAGILENYRLMDTRDRRGWVAGRPWREGPSEVTIGSSQTPLEVQPRLTLCLPGG